MSYQQYSPTGSRLPEVVKNLLIINGIFFFATILLERQHIDLADILGLHYFGSDKFHPYQLITYMFMHGSFMHIFFNMFALWMFGGAIENIWGPKKFLVYYIFTGLGAAITHYAVVYYTLQPGMAFINDYIAHPTFEKLQLLGSSDIFRNFQSSEIADHYNSFSQKFNELINTDHGSAMKLSVDYMQSFKVDLLNAPVVVGASGAVFGLLLAFGMIFPDTLLYLYFAIPVKAKYFVIGYGLIELFSGVANIPGDNVAHFAHLGGLLFGFILIMYWRNQNRRRNKYFS
ncbi:MAG: rhomboid family intramembrane serine protease [Bacteroidetes bacterium]|nr:rhomboid family intramembrane serine protease [Bacteroidota bacterium]